MIAAFQKLSPTPPGSRGGNIFTFDPPLPLAAPDNCTATIEFVVPLHGQSEREEKIRATAQTATPLDQGSGIKDRDTLRLTCVQP